MVARLRVAPRQVVSTNKVAAAVAAARVVAQAVVVMVVVVTVAAAPVDLAVAEWLLYASLSAFENPSAASFQSGSAEGFFWRVRTCGTLLKRSSCLNK